MTLSLGSKPLEVGGIIYLDFTNEYVGILECQIIVATPIPRVVHFDNAGAKVAIIAKLVRESV